MAASRSGGSAGENRGAPRLSTPSGTVTTTCEPSSDVPSAQRTRTPPAEMRDLGHLHAQPQIDAGGHRVHQAPVAPVRHIAEVVPVVLDLVPHPAQRLALGEVGGLGLDERVQRLARPPAPGPGPGRPRPRTPRSRPPRTHPGRVRRRSRRPPPGRPRGTGRGSPRPRRPTGGGPRRSRSRPAPAAGSRCGRARRPAARRRASGSPTGMWIHDPPRSTGEPARSTVCSRPPIRSRASSTTHSTPPCASAFATVSPAIPAPTTSTRSTVPASPPGTSARPSSKLPAVNPGHPRVGELPRYQRARVALSGGSATRRRAGRQCRTRCLPGPPCTGRARARARDRHLGRGGSESAPGDRGPCRAALSRVARPATGPGADVAPAIPVPAALLVSAPMPGPAAARGCPAAPGAAAGQRPSATAQGRSIPWAAGGIAAASRAGSGQRDSAPRDRGPRAPGLQAPAPRDPGLRAPGVACAPARAWPAGVLAPLSRGPAAAAGAQQREAAQRDAGQDGRAAGELPGPAGSPKTTTPATAPTSGSRLRKAPATSADTRLCP